MISVLLECAEHTIAEDCTMGLSYLLNLPDDYLPSITEFFENLVQNELHSQILAYFCSIKLYSKMFPVSDKVFSYAPVELIRHMLNIKTSSDNEDEKKLKQQISLLLQKEKLDDKCKSSIENKELEEKYVVPKDMEDAKLKIKKNSSLDYVPPTDEIDEWDNKWDNEASEDTIEFKDKSNDIKEEVKIKSTLDYAPAHEEMDEWINDWGDETTENAVELGENSNDKKSEINEKLTLDYIPSTEETSDWDDWGDERSKDVTELEQNSNDMKSEIKEKLTLDYVPSADDISSWDNNWEDETLNAHLVESEDCPRDTINKSVTEVRSALDYVPPAKEKDEWNSWGEEWAEIPESANENVERPDSANMNIEETADFANSSELSVEKRYEIFKDNFSSIQTVDDCRKVKDMLLQWPDINNLRFDDDPESNVALSMIIKMANIRATNSNSNDTIFHEIKDFLREELIPHDVSKFVLW